MSCELSHFRNAEVVNVCTNVDIIILSPSPQITESCRSCVCGHVFEDAKKIGGKRFSGNFLVNPAKPVSFRVEQVCSTNYIFHTWFIKQPCVYKILLPF